MDSNLREFLRFLQQKYGGEPRVVRNREPVSVKIPIFQQSEPEERFDVPEQFGQLAPLLGSAMGAGLPPEMGGAPGFGEDPMMQAAMMPQGMPRGRMN
jgi:hypothetical protein